MSEMLREIKRKLDKLEREADELKRGKEDYLFAKYFRGIITSTNYHNKVD